MVQTNPGSGRHDPFDKGSAAARRNNTFSILPGFSAKANQPGVQSIPVGLPRKNIAMIFAT
ncbi:hypothetical protein A8C56_22745 [Niabella ginsenosidivorans]|uniref:Uncharacterized protein n=1 Tax=Niabella ginsenosidivorans TaxID=1176587 RepID=A0A1A9I769_9BACT|nr:hypothetical protein A8C56_22745 [Niabella ginsenosidivorans]